ncbi:MAG: hypothetical protein GY847_16360 [Proteobacteria bacterium]|nr:hypothetical protein [Pseudomonadota bacterium]
MQSINPDLVSNVIISHFLASLMKIERERLGLTRKNASREAEWSATAWGELERQARALMPEHWMKASEVLGLAPEDVVRRLNAFIEKYSSVWMERRSDGQYKYCERPITSPRALRSGKTVNVDLNRLRPTLYYELSTFSTDPGGIIEQANLLGFFASRDISEMPSEAPRSTTEVDIRESRLERLINTISEMPEEKIGLLERIIDKFERFPAKELAHAYRHFSLSVSRR